MSELIPLIGYTLMDYLNYLEGFLSLWCTFWSLRKPPLGFGKLFLFISEKSRVGYLLTIGKSSKTL